MLKDVFLAGAVRTAIGTFGGGLAETPAPALGAAVVAESLKRAGIDGSRVDEVIFGNVISAGLGQNVARQCAIGAGLPVAVGATTVNKVCGSGLKAVMLAAQAIQCRDARVIVAGGTENMSRAPYLLERARFGYRMGNGELVDAMIRDGLWDVYNHIHMGTCGDRCAVDRKISRERQDDFAVASFNRTILAQAEGAMEREIVPVANFSVDQTPAKFNEQKLRQLRPAFGAEGTVTAGNASSISDGAAAIVVLDGETIRSLAIRPQARVLGYATASREPEWFTVAPIGAIRQLLDQLALKVADVDLFEINEAFSVVPLVAMDELAIPHEKVNVHGGAIALGHPIGASGCRILVTLINALSARKGKIGVASLCIGGGEAVALAIEMI